MTKQQIEASYRRFIEEELHEPLPSQIEYIGINFHEQLDDPPVFKCYYSTKESLQSNSKILRPFLERDMIHALNLIRDTHHLNSLRFEIGLHNRSNDNMKWLYEWIGNSFALSRQQRDALNYMARWTCCSLTTHRYAALYYLGFIANAHTFFPLKAVKPHYILRTCENPDKIGKNYLVNTEGILKFLKSSEIPALATLADALSPVANSKNELWMAAMDFFSNPDLATKYKVYLKDKGGILLPALERMILSQGQHGLAEQMTAFATWLDGHADLELYGAAVCLTSDGKWSVNCYL